MQLKHTNRISSELELFCSRKITELEEELKVVGNNMKTLEQSEQEVSHTYVGDKTVSQTWDTEVSHTVGHKK